MKKTKKMLNIAGILCVFVALLCVGSLMLDIFYNEYSVFNIAVDSIAIVLSLATAITYFILAKKDVNYLIKNRNIFLIIVTLNIFNNIIAWFVSFWVEMSIMQLSRVEKISDLMNNATPKQPPENEDVVVLDKNDYEVQNIVDTLKAELEKLEEMKRQGLIDENEYQVMRKELIDKSFS